MQDQINAGAAMVILPCPSCGRAVKVLGRVRRVLCACGQVLMEMALEESSPTAASPAPPLEVRRAG
jgi:hypothetical protein